MPKVVDHDRRREQLADAALSLIAKHGMRGVTTRAVAEEAGWSTGVLTHYSKSLSELLLAALRRAAELQGRIFREMRAEKDLDAVQRLALIVDSVLPLDDRRMAMNRIFSVYYAEVGVNEATRDEVIDYLDQWRRLVERIVRSGQEDGSIASTRSPAQLAVDIVALADGLSIHASIDPRILERLQAEPAPGVRIVRTVLGSDVGVTS